MNHSDRLPRNRTYLMCSPDHFTVEYAINPWMDTTAPVDATLAFRQWEMLRTTLADLGHTVHVLNGVPGLPDMVYAANGAFSVDGKVYGARFKFPQRAAEADAHQLFYASGEWSFASPGHVNEGEGDFAYLPEAYGGMVLAGYGFRTDPAAHAEAQEVLGRPVISLKLVDPAFYHLDTALAALDDRHIAYYPDAFSPASQRVLAQLFPDAVIADRHDAEAFGLNLVSDGRHVVLNTEAVAMGDKVRAAGYLPVHVELTELKRGGGSVKCAVAELRPGVLKAGEALGA
ncbi:amidinotransferase [Actinoplanes sp. TBRC 11911]|uniref:dimethylargininase n=1 Tax=Actinoplanes sp. TBRC 11911 TaxID=2729386 RepID=UPI00145D4240|nr:dimethylargininase [Actinoplanes sp. TBRC 11911]NMO54459.1 amidinotransferase [Actinoplanes sp. TBRC 11911]